MTDDHPLFRWLWRLNAVLIAAAGALAILAAASALAGTVLDQLRRIESRDADRVDPPPAPAPPEANAAPAAPRFGPFSAVPGTTLLSAPITHAGAYDPEAVAADLAARPARNLILFDTGDGTARRVLPDERALVSEYRFLPSGGRGGAGVRATSLLVTLHPRDTDGDGRLSPEDAATIVLVPLDGRARLELFRDVPAARGVAEAPDGLVYVFAETRDGLGYAAIDPVAAVRRREGLVGPKF